MNYGLSGGVDMNVHPVMIFGLKMLEPHWAREFGTDHAIHITSGRRKSSNGNSIHPDGLALDLRSRHLTAWTYERLRAWAKLTSQYLTEFDLIFEGTLWKHKETGKLLEARAYPGTEYHTKHVRKEHFHFERDVGKADRKAGRI